MNTDEILLNVNYFDVENNLAEEQIRCISSQNAHELIEPPLFATHLAVGDKVLANQENNVWFWEETLEKSGNSTIHIVELIDGSIEKLLDKLQENNYLDMVRYIHSKYIALNIPKQFDYPAIQKILLDWEQQGKISFREACLGFQAA